MYLKVVNGTKSKEYTLTSQYNEKPYMIVSGTNKLPLTAKPPTDYSTSSESGSFYTTSETPGDLRETTALTRASTYETVYGTRASTYNTVYGTRQEARSSAKYHRYAGEDTYGYTTIYNISSTNERTSYGDNLTVYVRDDIDDRSYVTASYYIPWSNAYGDGYGFWKNKTFTTGTTYLTRASTSATSYLTQSSTSAYQGVSSTSSSTSYATNPGSNIYIKISKGTKTYRPLEYQSSSESASMYTTVSEDEWYLLSETTALTRESTSETVYNTRASTSKTVYGTKQEARSSAKYHRYAGDDEYGYTTVYNISRINGRTSYGDNLTVNDNGRNYVVASYYIPWSNAYGDGIRIYSYKTFTTGTTYQTRASTYQTIYHTCSSTSLYSGISSSSQSTMSWV